MPRPRATLRGATLRGATLLMRKGTMPTQASPANLSSSSAGRQRWTQLRRWERPVREQEIAPRLPDLPGPVGRKPGAMATLASDPIPLERLSLDSRWLTLATLTHDELGVVPSVDDMRRGEPPRAHGRPWGIAVNGG